MKIEAETAPKTKRSNQKPEKPLFPYGDWIAIALGIIVLAKTDGMGHYLGHAGILLLMLALVARPISFLWSKPLKYRRTIGILAFATSLAHAIYAFIHVFNGNLATALTLTFKHQWGMWAGILSLAAIAPAAVTSFQSLQKKLGKKWRQIHLLTVPALVLAALHTILIGPHYMAHFQIKILDYLRTYGIALAA